MELSEHAIFMFSVHLKESAPIRTLEELSVRASITKQKTKKHSSCIRKETSYSVLQVGSVYHKII